MKYWCRLAQVSEFFRCVKDTCTRTTSSTATSSLDPTEGCERKKQTCPGLFKARKHHVRSGLDDRVISQDGEAHRLRHVSVPWNPVHVLSAKDLLVTRSGDRSCALRDLQGQEWTPQTPKSRRFVGTSGTEAVAVKLPCVGVLGHVPNRPGYIVSSLEQKAVPCFRSKAPCIRFSVSWS